MTTTNALLIYVDPEGDAEMFDNLFGWEFKQYCPSEVWPKHTERTEFSVIEQFDDGVMFVEGFSFLDGRKPVIEVHDIEWRPD